MTALSPPPAVRRWQFWFSVIGLLAFFASLNWFDDWTREENPVRFVTLAIMAGVFYLQASAQFARGGGGRSAAIVFWSVALLLRLLAFPMTPGDDLYRYQWEGRIQQAGFNPYLLAPEAPELAGERERFEDWWRINHRDYRAIYPAGAELVFRGLHALTSSGWPYKALFAVADLLAVGLLLRIVGGGARHAVGAWYAWNPLLAYSFAGAAHFDSLMLAPLMGAILLLLRSEAAGETGARWKFAAGSAFLLGLAISIKLIPALLLPLFALALRRRAPALALAVLVPVALSLPFGFPHVRIWDSLGDFAYVTRLNDLFWWIIEDTVWPNPRQKNYRYTVIILGVVALVSLFFWRNWKRGMLWVLGAALILSPVLHPWYCTWILALAAWRRAYAWHVLSVSLFAYYLFWNERLFLLPWRSELWLRLLIIVPPLLVFLAGLLERRKSDIVTQGE